ncbi:Fatty acid desaturase [Ceratobasidium sp. AG-Ba]|nr:Fatty acid desaturase [Ceratobasidium sp. AG-Ba]
MGVKSKAKAAAKAKMVALEAETVPEKFIVPELTVKDLLSVIPAHCFERSALRSFSYVAMDFGLLGVFYYTAATFIPRINSTNLPLSSLVSCLPSPVQPLLTAFEPYVYPFARFACWNIYALAAGLVGTGLWIIAHECGHQAFSTSKSLNNAVGWVLHSALGVPYHSWRISHAKHHAATSHCTRDEAYVPRTRSEKRLPARREGERPDEKIQEEMLEAIGDSPIGAAFGVFALLLFGWPLYLLINISGQKSYPKWTNHFMPGGVLFAPHQQNQILLSDFGVFIWLATLFFWSMKRGFFEMFTIYFVPYLWVNHWLILITFLQHTDPVLPHYRASAFTFTRGALSTLDRSLLGGEGFLASITGWLGATLTHGISETHVLHHVSSKIPHYHAWEASRHLKARLARAGYSHEGRPGTWGEVYRVWRECKFIEDEGDVVFYKNARGLAARQAVFLSEDHSDSGVDIRDE